MTPDEFYAGTGCLVLASFITAFVLMLGYKIRTSS